jgi:hypothetical protein
MYIDFCSGAGLTRGIMLHYSYREEGRAYKERSQSGEQNSRKHLAFIEKNAKSSENIYCIAYELWGMSHFRS